MDQEIYTLLQKGVIAEAYHSHGDFLSNVFLRPKKDGSFRMILNLKNLNSHVEYNKFKMDTCLLYTSPSPRDGLLSRMPSSA